MIRKAFRTTAVFESLIEYFRNNRWKYLWNIESNFKHYTHTFKLILLAINVKQILKKGLRITFLMEFEFYFEITKNATVILYFGKLVVVLSMKLLNFIHVFGYALLHGVFDLDLRKCSLK